MALIATLPPLEERRQLIDELCEKYVKANGADPPAGELIRLTHWLLYEELTGKNKRWADCPVYTVKQLKANDRRYGTPVPYTEANENFITATAIDHREVATHFDALAKRGREVAQKRRARRAEALRERIQQAKEANPTLTNDELAKILGISRMTLYRYTKTMKT